MKKSVLGLIIFILIISVQHTFAEFKAKTLLDDHNKEYVTISYELYKVDFPEYDTIEVTCFKTGKQHIFKLSSDAYQLLNEYYYDAKTINDLNKIVLFDITKIPHLT